MDLNRNFYSISAEETLQALESSADGLSSSEASRRLSLYGPNQLPEHGPDPLWWIIIRQFASPLIYILVAAAIVSILIGDVEDAGFIAIILSLNAAIGAYQESQAERSSHALKRLLRTHAQVMRDGKLIDILATDVVPGDVVWLESGNRVSADLRLLSSTSLEIDESLLTGESTTVHKDYKPLSTSTATIADQHNMTFAGSMVTRGRGRGIAVATGTSTQLGQLAVDVLGASGGKPPLIARMERFTNHIAIGTVAASILIGSLGILLWNYSLTDTFFLVVALIVSAIPEGLPVAMTIALAVATSRMAQRNVIVRRLTAVEGLGSCTLIATDKTGTLTCNELTVRELHTIDGKQYNFTGEGFAPRGHIEHDHEPLLLPSEPSLQIALEAGVLCNEAELNYRDNQWHWHGDAVDIALLSAGFKAGLEKNTLLAEKPLISQIPFESENQFASTTHQLSSGLKSYLKGSPERIAAMCANRLDEAQVRWIHSIANDMAERGLRIIALAQQLHSNQNAPNLDHPNSADHEFLGMVGMIDPLRPDVADSIAQCHAAGVEVKMITGDHRVTALAIARDLGLATSLQQVITANELEGKSPAELKEIVQRVRVFARVSPRQKLNIVNAARDAGHFVAVTGDGANDAPALQVANIGVAMGKSGTDVAREAAELVISDDNFRSIVSGIEEGRIAYDNIRKVTFLLVSLGAAELLMVLLSVVTGHPIPLLPVQLLWLNLVTDGIQSVALAFEPGEGDSLKHPPRPPSEPIFNRLMIERMAITVLTVGFGGFCVFSFALQSGWNVDQARNLLLLVMVLFENFHIGNCRSETKSAFALSPLRSPLLFYGTIAAFAIHVLAMYVPFLQNILGTKPLSVDSWLIAVGVALLIVPALELHKLSWKFRSKN
jgi:magnesium-transporting ATPase (P-type)